MKKRIAFIFPGQGSQYSGMLDKIKEHKVTQAFLNEFQALLGYRFEDFTDEELLPTNVTQPALFTTSCIYFEILQEKGIRPFFIAGHSLGEFSALYAGGFFSFQDGLQIVSQRGAMMSHISKETPGKMAAIIGLLADDVLSICQEASGRGIVEAVNFNSINQIVISGDVQSVNAASVLAKERGAKLVIPLQVSAPFHSSLLKPMAEKFSKELNKLSVNNLKIPIVQNFDGKAHGQAGNIIQNLVFQLYNPVLWSQSISELIDRGAEEFIEIGPKKVLSGLLKKASIPVYSSEDLV